MLITTVEHAKMLEGIVARSAIDAGLRQRPLTEPRMTLEAAGIRLPAVIEVRSVEATARRARVVLPVAPEEGAIPDDELADAAGGATPFAVTIVIGAISPILVVAAMLANFAAFHHMGPDT